MPRKITPKACACGCGQMTKGGKFKPGHDSGLLSALVATVGGIDKLRDVVEEQTGEKVTMHLEELRRAI